MASDNLRGPTRRSYEIQEEVVTALHQFADAIGAPIKGPDGMCVRARLDAIGPALAHIMAAQGYYVMEVQ